MLGNGATLTDLETVRQRKDGSRGLVVPNIKAAEALDFKQFWVMYEELVHKARTNRLTPDDSVLIEIDFAGDTINKLGMPDAHRH